MKTIVLFFVLVVGLTVVAAGRTKKHRSGSSDTSPDDAQEWPNAQSVGDFGAPPDFGGSQPTPIEGGQPPSGDDSPPARSHVRSSRRQHN